MRLFGGELGGLQIAASLLELKLSFDHIHMGDVAGLLLLFGDVHKVLRFGKSLDGIRDFSPCVDQTIVILRDGEDETSRGDLFLCDSDGLSGLGAAVLPAAK